MITAAGNFYIVVFLVENNARRVNHEWVDSIAYIMDERGNLYENLPWAQKAFHRASRSEALGEHVTPPGSSESTVLVFDLPEGVQAPGLKVRGETLMGDLFDGGRFRKSKIRLW
jgi:hypothetical protein